MKLILAISAIIGLVSAAAECPHDKEVMCIDDINKSYPVCKKAAEAGGSDTAADLQCLKYFNKMKPECWPCICFFAHEFKVDIKGC